MDLKQFTLAVFAAANDLIGREEELCKLDSFIGDGDHGMSIKKGFGNVIKTIDAESATNFSDFLSDVAMAFSETAGGAIGPIMASFFLGMSQAVTQDQADLGINDLAAALKSGTQRVQALGGAQVGDCTMVDALVPAYNALEQNADANWQDALEAMVQAAHEGALSTKDLPAKKGRARYLNEKSIGYIDAGSMSMYYFLSAFSASLKG